MAVLHKICFISLFFLLGACASIPNDAILENALSSADKRIKKVMDNIGQYEIQIRYTQIDRVNDSIIFTDHDFQVNPQNYFYPASTVKFPTAVTTLEKLNGMDSIDRNFKFYIEGDSVETTFAHNITEIFAISGNEANNRLIEFLGQDDLNERMKRRGVAPIRISHRLSTINADEVSTKPLVIYYNDTMVTTTKTIINSPPKPLSLKNIKKGDGYYVEDSLYMKPFDFSLKNYFPIEAQSRLLKRIIFPKAFPIEEQFDLTSAQHQFLLDAMQALPKSAGYDTEEYYDSYGKFFMFGDWHEPIPENVKIYNKVGYAYGSLTDCAYIKDTQNNIDFMLIATILVNKDGIFNDDQYEYDDIGIPFLAQLGREIYALELKRQR
ncbi:MAG: hypothetical protein HKP24_05875 [Croceitalea sp.]|nr:hypothetical protein [Croceitalea sp.]